MRVSRLLLRKPIQAAETSISPKLLGRCRGRCFRSLLPRSRTNMDQDRAEVATQVAVDDVFNVLKEFWPDIDRAVFRGHYGSRPVL
jgi:hypothetical protein